jgi:hypothetical protein
MKPARILGLGVGVIVTVGLGTFGGMELHDRKSSLVAATEMAVETVAGVVHDIGSALSSEVRAQKQAYSHASKAFIEHNPGYANSLKPNAWWPDAVTKVDGDYLVSITYSRHGTLDTALCRMRLERGGWRALHVPTIE